MAEIPVLFFVILHWCIALPMIAPLMTSFNVTYDAKDTMEVLVPPSSLALSNMISMVSVFILFFICVFCYVFVINHILRSRFTTTVTKRHEIRLSIQFAGLMIAFLFVFIYSIGQYVLNEMREIDLLYDWRQLNPIMNGFLSCVQPWMCLFFNKEIRNKLKGIVGCRQKQNEANQGSMFKQSTPLSRR
ncbi:hypothetical protein RB195_003296 [Necator americanus]|uniref:Serpentine receptor class gamma n=1 Tax=Necator americanus TaxID=51031 RepID=A0ABR1DP93_NECAM